MLRIISTLADRMKVRPRIPALHALRKGSRPTTLDGNTRLRAAIDTRLLMLLIGQTQSRLWATFSVGMLSLAISPLLANGRWIVAIVLLRAVSLAQNHVASQSLEAKLKSGISDPVAERKLVWGLAVSTFLWGLLTLPLDLGQVINFPSFVILTIALFSVCLAIIAASYHRSSMIAVALAGVLGFAPKVALMTMQVGLMLPIAFAVYMGTVLAYSGTLLRQARGSTLLELRRRATARHLAKVNAELQTTLIHAQSTLVQAQRNADRDYLTEMRNRRAFERDLGDFMVRFAHRRCVLMLIDLDHFKLINDQFGHSTGDGVLLAVGTCLSQWEQSDSGRMTGRWGGEEFICAVALRPGERLRDRAEELREGIAMLGEQLHWPDTVSLTASIGCADLAGRESIDQALAAADCALYAAKEAGRNRCKLAA